LNHSHEEEKSEDPGLDWFANLLEVLVFGFLKLLCIVALGLWNLLCCVVGKHRGKD
jgi:hypothetical protein